MLRLKIISSFTSRAGNRPRDRSFDITWANNNNNTCISEFHTAVSVV
jgi:hypothetical protein